MANAQPAHNNVGIDHAIDALEQIIQDPLFDPQVAENLILAALPQANLLHQRRERARAAFEALLILRDGFDGAGNGVEPNIGYDALQNIGRDIRNDRHAAGLRPIQPGQHGGAGVAPGYQAHPRVQPADDMVDEVEQARVRRERDALRNEINGIPDYEELFGDVHWMFDEPPVPADPIPVRDIAVGPDLPGDDTPHKVADKYRSNKGDPRDPIPEATRNCPEFRAHRVEIKTGEVSLFTHRFINHKPLCEEDVYAHLQSVSMFMPRTPSMAIYLRERALRFIEGFDTMGLSRMEVNNIIGSAVSNAYLPSVEEMTLINTVEYIPNEWRLSRHNQFFKTGDSNLSTVTGPNHSQRPVSVAQRWTSKHWILATGLLVMGSLVILRKQQYQFHIPTF